MVMFNCVGCDALCNLELLDDHPNEWNYYEDQHEDFKDGYHIVHMKIQHTLCDTTNLVKIKYVVADIEVEEW